MTEPSLVPVCRVPGFICDPGADADRVLVAPLEMFRPVAFEDYDGVTRVLAYTGEAIGLDSDASHFIIVHSGTAQVGATGRRFALDAECYACLSGAVTIEGDAQALVVSTVGYRCAPLQGGPVEERGRLRYVDGCTASLLLPPPLRGEPCLNFMHLPDQITQTMHTHPSLRCGLILSGAGACVTEQGTLSFLPGTVFFIPPETPHSFQSGAETLRIVIYHPDSDSGPTHEDHTMLNRTFVAGQSARTMREIHTAESSARAGTPT